ncbi:MAG: RDD family protein [Sulfuricellaceae bacterium]|nr:RDD family protein [Sulfuricellaceae bacterium]
MPNTSNSSSAPGLLRPLLSMCYDGLLLLAVLFIASFLFVVFTHTIQSPAIRPLFQIYILTVAAAYFLWFWLHGGQTLPMKTWKIKLLDLDGRPISLKRGIVRFLIATIGIGLLGLGILWALVDRDRQFLHDRLTGSKLVLADEGQ